MKILERCLVYLFGQHTTKHVPEIIGNGRWASYARGPYDNNYGYVFKISAQAMTCRLTLNLKANDSKRKISRWVDRIWKDTPESRDMGNTKESVIHWALNDFQTRLDDIKNGTHNIRFERYFSDGKYC